MATVKILDNLGQMNWEYDEEADVLYISVGDPVQALGVDIGEGLILRYDEPKNEVVGITILSVRSRLMHELEAPKS